MVKNTKHHSTTLLLGLLLMPRFQPKLLLLLPNLIHHIILLPLRIRPPPPLNTIPRQFLERLGHPLSVLSAHLHTWDVGMAEPEPCKLSFVDLYLLVICFVA